MNRLEKQTKNYSVEQGNLRGRSNNTDKSKFVKTLTEGFGKKKAYGFGMMTVIPENK